MANPEQLKILKSGVENWNRWRDDNPNVKINLRNADLSGLCLVNADLRHAFLMESNLSESNLSDANLIEADFRLADLFKTNFITARLNKANFIEASLIETDLRMADLSEAKFNSSYLLDANLIGAILIGADLNGAHLDRADLSMVNLSFANLTEADLSSATLVKTTLNQSIFERTLLGETVFVNVNLSEVKNLDSCLHLNPSYVDYHTLQKSGTLPISFLRGCGLPDIFINYLPSLTEQPIQFYYCFISYSTKDQEFTERLFSDLQNKGVRAWYAPHDLQAGKKVFEQIDVGIKRTEKLLLILSESSMNSEWVKTEITKAFKKEKEIGKQVLFPISLTKFKNLRDWECFDSDYGRDLAKEIREYHIPNFENWKDHDEYKVNFDKLVGSLKIEN